MAARGHQRGELFRKTMLARAANVSPDDIECMNESRSDSLLADVELTGKKIVQNEASTREGALDPIDDQPRDKSKGKGKRKATNPPEPSAKKAKKWAWTAEAVKLLLKYIKEYKSKCEFNGVDFEADLLSMYTEVRRCLAVDFPNKFRPEFFHDPGKDLKDMDNEEYESCRKRLEDKKQKIRLGYQRIKEKVKNVRRDYRSAVNKGTRSGSGKVVQDNYDLLTDIWGGSPATTALTFGIDGEVDETAGSSGATTDREDEGSESR